MKKPLVVAIALASLTLPARAVEIDFSQSLTYHGEVQHLCEAPKDATPDVVKRCKLPLTLGSVVSQALDAPDGQNLSGDEKFRRGSLANKVWGAEKLDISPEDQVLMKAAVGKAWPTAVVTQVWPMLDPSKKP